jgi:hypothetical protein
LFFEIIQESFDKGFHSIGIFIDLTKVYDWIIKYYWKNYHSMELGASRTYGSSLVKQTEGKV